VTINNGDIQIPVRTRHRKRRYTINDGRDHNRSSDDGITSAGGNDGSGMNRASGPAQVVARSRRRTWQVSLVVNSGHYLITFNGGTIYVNATASVWIEWQHRLTAAP
jgi:hypothetical protein